MAIVVLTNMRALSPQNLDFLGRFVGEPMALFPVSTQHYLDGTKSPPLVDSEHLSRRRAIPINQFPPVRP
jgi:hypothetical protein